MKKQLITALFISIVSTSASAGSAFSDAKDSVTYRQASFQLIRHNMADIADMLKGEVSYDAERVTKRATALATLTSLPWEAFTVPGAEQGGGDAKAAIWQNLDDFNSRGAKLVSDAATLKAAADAGDQAETRKAFGNFARNCKACHEQYKE
ncbi:c-type cytochrome [Rheinheimera baltica]|uniref:c-type cytochrome n=1 Tax=Rheinheimera baltica TaxID=67576 RepID=UPI000411B0E7|nr:cytochrome c [Rheinheimera baltica]